MLAERPDRDDRDGARERNGDEQQQRGEERERGADAKDLPVGEAVQRREDRDEQHAGRLAKELQDAALEARDVVGLDEEVVERGAEAAHADAPHEDAREERAGANAPAPDPGRQTEE